MESDNLSKIMSQWLSTLLVLGTVFVSLIMLAGYSYNFGYLNGFGLGPDELALTIYDSVSGAFGVGVVYLGEIFKRISWLYYVLGFLGICIVAGAVIGFVLAMLGYGEEIFQNRFFRFTDNVAKEIQIWSMYAIVVVLLIFGLPYCLVAKPYLMGNEQSKKAIERYEAVQFECSKLPSAGYACSSLRNLDTGKIEAQGLLVATTDKVIAIRDRELNRIFSRSPEYVLEILPAKQLR